MEQAGRYDAFISYARADGAFVETLTRALEARGKNVYVDLDDIPPGAAWHRHVLRGIEASKVVVAVLSPESVVSEVCAQELAHALATGKRIVPVVRRTVQPRELPAHLTAPNWIWLRDEDDAQAGEQALVAALELDEEWVDAHTRLTVRAREWDDAARDRSFLLRGSDLEAAEQWLARQGEHAESATAIQVQYILDSRQAASRRRRGTFGAVLAALAIAVTLAVLALVARQEAVRQSQTAQSRELAAAANSQLDADPELSVLLAAEGARIAPTSQATAALRTALSASHLDAQARMAVVPVGPPALSPDGRYVLQGGLDGAGRVFDLGNGSVAALLRPRGLPKAQAEYYDGGPDFGAAFASDGRHVATVSFDGVARVWDWRARRVVATRPEVGKVRLAFSPDGRTLAAGATLWDWRRDRARTIGGDAFHSLVAFAPDGRSVVAVAVFGGAAVSDVRTGRTLARLPAPENDDATQSIAFSADGRRIVRGTSDGVAEVWDWRRARRLARLRPGGAFAETRFARDAKTVLVGTTDGKIFVWDWEAGNVSSELRGHRGPVAGLALARDGRLISTGTDRTIRRWRLPSRGVTVPAPARRFVTSADIGRDGRTGVAGGPTYPAGFGDPRRIVEIFDEQGGRRLAGPAEAPVGSGDHDPWLRVELSPDGRFVAGASDSGLVHVWDWRARREVALLRHGARFVGEAAFSPDGALVATTTTDRGVYVWSWRERRVLRRLKAAPDQPTFPGHVDFAPDGDAIVVTEGSLVRVQDWRRGRVLARLTLPAGAADASFDPSGRLVAVAGDDGVARVIDWRSGRTLAELRGGGAVTTATFSSDGGLLLTGDLDAATVWDWRLEQRILDLAAPPHKPLPTDAGIGDARFSADAKRIVTAGTDNRAHLYDCEVCVPLDELLDQARRRATRELSAEERRRYLHEDG